MEREREKKNSARSGSVSLSFALARFLFQSHCCCCLRDLIYLLLLLLLLSHSDFGSSGRCQCAKAAAAAREKKASAEQKSHRQKARDRERKRERKKRPLALQSSERANETHGRQSGNKHSTHSAHTTLNENSRSPSPWWQIIELICITLRSLARFAAKLALCFRSHKPTTDDSCCYFSLFLSFSFSLTNQAKLFFLLLLPATKSANKKKFAFKKKRRRKKNCSRLLISRRRRCLWVCIQANNLRELIHFTLRLHNTQASFVCLSVCILWVFDN